MNKESLLMQSLYMNRIQSLALCKLPSFLTQLPYPASLMLVIDILFVPHKNRVDILF